jgi:glycosyltransferase involved in cell wall biosynthesis
MKIGIDARMLGEEQTGIGLYIKNLIENIAKLDKEDEYILFLRKEQFDSFELPEKNFKKVLADYRWYSFSEQFYFLFKLYFENLDLVHFPSFNAPIFYFKKRITTIHDLTPKYFPGHKMNSFLRRFASNMVFLRSISGSRKIISVSEYTKKEILKFYKIKSEKIEVIYQGIPNANKNTTKATAQNHQVSDDRQILGDFESKKIFKKNFLEKYKIRKPYIFYTGVWRNHKNIVGLVYAFERLREKYNKDILLVLGGKEDPFYPEVRKTWENLGLKDNIITPGFIKNEEMGIFLKNAEVFVLPSFVEGFGFGPLEALSYGTPVAVSDAGAMPEVLGESALYFDPNNNKDIAEKINKLLEDDGLRKALIEEGKKRLVNYTWISCTKNTLRLYKKYA